MTATEIITAISIYLVVPLIGVFLFFKLIKSLRKEHITNTSIFELFIIFATYGGLLLIILTSLFWQWSGIASLGMVYLAFIAPVIMGVIAYRNYRKRKTARFHRIAFISGIIYCMIPPLSFFIMGLIFR